MSRPGALNQAQEQSFLKTQNDLIDAHISLIRMQQQLLGMNHSPQSDEDNIKIVMPPYAEKAELPLKDQSELGYVGDSQSQPSDLKHPQSSFAAGIRKNAVFLVTAGLFTTVTLFVSLRPSTNPVVVQNLQNEISSIKDAYEKRLVQEANALTQNQRELENTQKSLKQAIVALENAQENLREIRDESFKRPQEIVEPTALLLPLSKPIAVRSESTKADQNTSNVTETNRESGSNNDPLKAIVNEIRKIRSATVANIREIFTIQKVYLSTSYTLAKTRFDDAVSQKIIVLPTDLNAVQTAVLDYLPVLARELNGDTRFTSTASLEELFPMPEVDEPVHGSYDEVVRVAAAEARRLTEAQKKVISMQNQLLLVQDELRNFRSVPRFKSEASDGGKQ